MTKRLEEIEARVKAADKPFPEQIAEMMWDEDLVTARDQQLAKSDVPFLLAYAASLEAEVNALRFGTLSQILSMDECECGADDGSDYPQVVCYLHEALAKADAIAKDRERL